MLNNRNNTQDATTTTILCNINISTECQCNYLVQRMYKCSFLRRRKYYLTFKKIFIKKNKLNHSVKENPSFRTHRFLLLIPNVPPALKTPLQSHSRQHRTKQTPHFHTLQSVDVLTKTKNRTLFSSSSRFIVCSSNSSLFCFTFSAALNVLTYT